MFINTANERPNSLLPRSRGLASVAASAQTLTNASLTGKYFVRHVQFTAGANNNVTDARSIIGAMTFNPANGSYSFTGQQVIGADSPVAFSVNGLYSVSPAGLVTLTNPQTTSATLNARFGAEAVVGSSTEIGGNTFDLFVAIPAPSAAQSNATAAGGWNAADFELTCASTAQVRTRSSHSRSTARAISRPLPLRDTRRTTIPAPDRRSAIISGNYPSTRTVPEPLLSRAHRLYRGRADDELLPAHLDAFPDRPRSDRGHSGAHDILIAILAAAAAVDAEPRLVRRHSGRFHRFQRQLRRQRYSNRVRQRHCRIAPSERIPQRHSCQRRRRHSYYTLASDGTGSAGPSQIAGGAGGIVSANTGGPLDPTGYEIGFAVTIPVVSGTGVFINPQGVVNAASNAPVGNPISPGEFIAIYGSGLSSQTTTATPPYPGMLGNVSRQHRRPACAGIPCQSGADQLPRALRD